MAFFENKQNELVYMCSEKIPMQHMFTTRFGGVSTGELQSLNLGFNRGDDRERVMENYRRVCAVLGVSADYCAITCQVHKNDVKIVTEEDVHVWGTDIPYEADGIVTAEKNLPIFCFAADCIPVLLSDPVHGVAGAVHCGWRSSVTDILANAVEKMLRLGAEKEDIRVALGPAIGACCFETDEDVPEAVTRYLGGETDGLFRRKENGKTLVDLRGANARRLVQLGIPRENIDISNECTYCSHDKYWSHRYTKGLRGTQCAVIVIR